MSDYSVTASIEKRLKDASREINQLAPEYGKAKQVIEFSSDQRKNVLARYVAKELKSGDTSYAAAETIARANEAYQAELNGYADVLELAHATIGKWDALHCTFDAARSLLAMSRETLKTMPE